MYYKYRFFGRVVGRGWMAEVKVVKRSIAFWEEERHLVDCTGVLNRNDDRLKKKKKKRTKVEIYRSENK